MHDYYQLLKIKRTDSFDTIRKAYKSLALKFHPDKNPKNVEESKRKFQQLSEAYMVLSNESKRKAYDIKIGVRNFTPEQSSNYSQRRTPFSNCPDQEHYNRSNKTYSNYYSWTQNNRNNSYTNRPGSEQNRYNTSNKPTFPFKQTTVSSIRINGVEITTVRVFENDTKTVLVYEDKVLKTKTVNGKPVPVP